MLTPPIPLSQDPSPNKYLTLGLIGLVSIILGKLGIMPLPEKYKSLIKATTNGSPASLKKADASHNNNEKHSLSSAEKDFSDERRHTDKIPMSMTALEDNGNLFDFDPPPLLSLIDNVVEYSIFP